MAADERTFNTKYRTNYSKKVICITIFNIQGKFSKLFKAKIIVYTVFFLDPLYLLLSKGYHSSFSTNLSNYKGP